MNLFSKFNATPPQNEITKLTGLGYIVSFLAVAILLAAGAEAGPDTTMPGLQAYLEEFSGILDVAEDRGREFISTRLSDPDAGGAFVLVYERKRYDSVETRVPSSLQIIHYPFALSDLNPSSMEVREWAGPLSGRPYYMVMATVEAEKRFIDYTNVVERRLEDGSVDVTSSRGKARFLALGYFREKETAQKFSDDFRDVLLRHARRDPVRSDREVAAEKRPTRLALWLRLRSFNPPEKLSSASGLLDAESSSGLRSSFQPS